MYIQDIKSICKGFRKASLVLYLEGNKEDEQEQEQPRDKNKIG